MIVRELLTRLGFELDEGKLEKYEEETNGAMRAMQGLVIVATAASVVLGELLHESSEWGDQVQRSAAIMRMTTTEVQQWQYIAKMIDTDFGTIQRSAIIMSRNLGNALQQGGESLRAFRIAAHGAPLAKDAGALFDQMLAGVARIKDPHLQDSISQQIFARGAIELASLIRKGPEAIEEMRNEFLKLGLGIDENGIKQLAEFDDGLKQVRAVIASIRNEVAAQFAPQINEAVAALREWWYVNKDIVKQGFFNFIQTLATLLHVVWLGLVGVVKILNLALEPFGGFNNALRLFLALWAAWKVAEIVIGLWELVQVLLTARTAMAAMNVVLVFTNLLIDAALAPVVLLTAAIFLLGLALQDIYVWMHGGKSLMGEWVGSFGDFQKKFDFIWDPDKGLTLGRNFGAAVGKGILEALTSALDDNPLWHFLQTLPVNWDLQTGAFSLDSTWVKNHPIAWQPGGGGAGGATVQVHAPITLALPAGVTDPAAFAEQFSQHVEEKVGRALRTNYVELEH